MNRSVFLSFIASLGFGCTAQVMAQTMDKVDFAITEPGVETAVEQWFVNDTHVRIHWAQNSDGFILYERASGKIYSVSHGDRTVMAIEPKEANDSALALGADIELAVHKQTSKDAPEIGGSKAVELALLANDTLCVQVAAVPGLLPRVLTAMTEYQNSLANQQHAILPDFPADQLTPCRLADDVLAPTRDLASGFPIIRWSPDGRSRQLINFAEKQPLEPSIFSLPDDYDQTGLLH